MHKDGLVERCGETLDDDGLSRMRTVAETLRHGEAGHRRAAALTLGPIAKARFRI